MVLSLIADTAFTGIQPQFWVSLGRILFLLVSLAMVWLLWHSSMLTERKRQAALVAGLVYFLFSSMADIVLVSAGKYHYAFDDNVYLGVPIDLHLGYACVFGVGLCLLWESVWSMLRSMLFVLAVTTAVLWDQWGLSSGRLLTGASSDWQAWDIGVHAALLFVTILFYRLVDGNKAVMLRSLVYTIGYFAFFYFLLPSIILSSSAGQAIFPVSKWRETVIAMALVCIPGAWAAAQFAISGRGTPLPLDPTRKLIVTGPYAYVRNPMQISLVGMACVWAYATESLALCGYAAALLLAIKLTRIYEEDGLHRRFGERYKKYARNVWTWVPRMMPYEEE